MLFFKNFTIPTTRKLNKKIKKINKIRTSYLDYCNVITEDIDSFTKVMKEVHDEMIDAVKESKKVSNDFDKVYKKYSETDNSDCEEDYDNEDDDEDDGIDFDDFIENLNNDEDDSDDEDEDNSDDDQEEVTDDQASDNQVKDDIKCNNKNIIKENVIENVIKENMINHNDNVVKETKNENHIKENDNKNCTCCDVNKDDSDDADEDNSDDDQEEAQEVTDSQTSDNKVKDDIKCNNKNIIKENDNKNCTCCDADNKNDSNNNFVDRPSNINMKYFKDLPSKIIADTTYNFCSNKDKDEFISSFKQNGFKDIKNGKNTVNEFNSISMKNGKFTASIFSNKNNETCGIELILPIRMIPHADACKKIYYDASLGLFKINNKIKPICNNIGDSLLTTWYFCNLSSDKNNEDYSLMFCVSIDTQTKYVALRYFRDDYISEELLK